MALHIQLYPFIPPLLTLTIFQGRSSVRQFQLKCLCSHPVKLKLCWIVKPVKQIRNIPLFLFYFHTHPREVIQIVLGCKKKKEKNLNIGLFSNIIKVRPFKLCIVITLLGVYIVILGLMTLTLFQGHMCVRHIICKFCCFKFLSAVV